MPSQIKAFWVFSVTVVICWIILHAHGVFLTARLAVSPQHAFMPRWLAIFVVSEAVIWCGATLSASWLAAFGRKNWARWVTVALLLYQLIPVIQLIVLAFMNHSFAILVAQNWEAHPSDFIVVAILWSASIAAIGFGTTPVSVRAWFKPHIAAA
jgi:hypothetical protein